MLNSFHFLYVPTPPPSCCFSCSLFRQPAHVRSVHGSLMTYWLRRVSSLLLCMCACCCGSALPISYYSVEMNLSFSCVSVYSFGGTDITSRKIACRDEQFAVEHDHNNIIDQLLLLFAVGVWMRSYLHKKVMGSYRNYVIGFRWTIQDRDRVSFSINVSSNRMNQLAQTLQIALIVVRALFVFLRKFNWVDFASRVAKAF